MEKPPPEVAEAIRAAGALWNTMVVAGPLWRFWVLGRRYLPELMGGFATLVAAIGTSDEVHVLNGIYEAMPRRNFSSDFLQHLRNAVAVIELTGVRWSDWGSPDRIVDTICGLGKRPAFAMANLAGSAGGRETDDPGGPG